MLSLHSCGISKYILIKMHATDESVSCVFQLFQMVQAIQVLRFHLLELEKVSWNFE